MGKYMNWQMGSDYLKNYFEDSIKQCGKVRILTVLNHVSSSGMTRYISAYIPIIVDGHADVVCIAREKKVTGCGSDMGFQLAYSLYCSVYGFNAIKDMPYQDYLSHSWM